jgi:hypothetical protein
MSRSPFARTAGAMLLAASLALAGCIKQTDVTVADDGSGTYTGRRSSTSRP